MKIYDNAVENLRAWYAEVPFKYKAAVAAAMLLAAGIGGARAGYAEGRFQGRKEGLDEGRDKWYEKGAIDAFNFIDRKGSELEKKALEAIESPVPIPNPQLSPPRKILPRSSPGQSPQRRRFYRPNAYCKPA